MNDSNNNISNNNNNININNNNYNNNNNNSNNNSMYRQIYLNQEDMRPIIEMIKVKK